MTNGLLECIFSNWPIFRCLRPIDENIINVHYSALNFRDIMLASGKLAPEVVAQKRFEQVRNSSINIVMKSICVVWIFFHHSSMRTIYSLVL